MLMGVSSLSCAYMVCAEYDIHAWVSASLFDKAWFSQDHKKRIYKTEVRVFCVYAVHPV